jgi:hypothetical protein
MKVLILVCTVALASAQQPGASKSAAHPGGKAPVTAETAPKPEAFRDPLRKVRNANGELVTANLQPLFSWFQRRKGPRPMETWGRQVATVVAVKPEGLVLLNYSDKKTFFLRNYPYAVAPNTMIQFFAIDSGGYYTYKDPTGAEHTLHAADYGIPVKPGSEKKSPAKPAAPTPKTPSTSK